MSCNKPLKAFKIGLTKNGKDQYKITNYNVNHVEYCGRSWQSSYVDSVSKRASKIVREFIEIPCGNCLQCRIDYTKQWADRCMLEMKNHESSYFLTVTYDDDHVPKSGTKQFDSDTGEYIGLKYDGECMSLRKKDLQDFFKRLRKNSKQKIRYYACGEYGDDTCRPHYHIIAFGLKLDDLVPLGNPNQRGCYYSSKLLDECWPNGKIIVAEATYETCAYTARYVMKKLKGKSADFYKLYDIEPEFVVMSRRPGIGREFYDDNKRKFIDYSSIAVGDSNGSHNIKPSRYFKSLLEIDFPEEWEAKKVINKNFAEDIKKLKLMKTSKSYLEMLADQEANLKDKVDRKKKKGV